MHLFSFHFCYRLHVRGTVTMSGTDHAGLTHCKFLLVFAVLMDLFGVSLDRHLRPAWNRWSWLWRSVGVFWSSAGADVYGGLGHVVQWEYWWFNVRKGAAADRQTQCRGAVRSQWKLFLLFFYFNCISFFAVKIVYLLVFKTWNLIKFKTLIKMFMN